MKKILPWVLTALLLLPVGLQVAHADSSSASTTGSATIAATCGLSIGTGGPLSFGSLANSGTSVDNTALTFTNAGSVTAVVTVAGTDWYDGSGYVQGTDNHIKGQYTQFETTDQNGGSVFATYGSFTKPLNDSSTEGTNNDGFVTFGVVKPGTDDNGTYWGLQATLINLPFSGSLTQTITFDAAC